MFTALRAHTLITTPPFPHALKDPLRVFRFPACPPRHTCFSPLAQAILAQARDGGPTLGLLIKLIGGEADAGEPRPAWVDEGARDGDHAQVRPPLYLISGTALLVTIRSSIRIHIRVQVM